MDIAAFFRVAIPVVLAVFSVGLILTVNVIFIGNAYYVLKHCLKKEKNIDIKGERQKSLRFEKIWIQKIFFPKQAKGPGPGRSIFIYNNYLLLV